MNLVSKKTKILFFISEDWYFWSHRLPIARAARDLGWDVAIATRVSNLGDKICAEGFKLIPLTNFKRRVQNPFKELQSVMEIFSIYQKERPDIVHHVALKPVMYGIIAARLSGIRGIVNALAGLGFLFTSESKSVSLIQKITLLLLRLFFASRHVHLILQNSDDLNIILSRGVVKKEQTVLIRGSGVDLHLFKPRPEQSGLPVVLLASRMLWNKGVGEFVEAARLLNADGRIARFVLVGMPDPENPASIPENRLQEWQNSGVVEWWGYRSDMPNVLAQANIVCLPSYREGLPKVLLEAAASGRAIITTNSIGCREVVYHGENGLLVPPRNPDALANAIKRLLDNPDLRISMGSRGREIVVQEFSEEIVVHKTLSLYKKLLGQ